MGTIKKGIMGGFSGKVVNNAKATDRVMVIACNVNRGLALHGQSDSGACRRLITTPPRSR